MNTRFFFLLSGLLIAVCIALRVLAARGDLWFDEIWSYYIVKQSGGSIWRILHTPHDNNHLLNSIYFCLLGETPRPAWIYRLPSVVASVLLVPIVGWASLGESRVERFLAMFFTALSLPLIVLGTEARGYGMAIMLSVLAWGLFRKGFGQGIFLCALSALAMILGVLSHYTAIFCYCALVAYSLGRFLFGEMKQEDFTMESVRGRCCQKSDWSKVAVICVLPGIVIAWLYFALIRNMVIGGGPFRHWSRVAREGLEYAAGSPMSGLGMLWCFAFLVILALSVRLLWAENRRSDILFFSTLLLVPVVYLCLQNHKYLHFRYFLIFIPFCYSLIGHYVGRLISLPGTREIAGCFVAIFAWYQINSFLTWVPFGRGMYSEAIHCILAGKTRTGLTVSAGHERNLIVFTYYWNLVSSDEAMCYVAGKEHPEGADWHIMEPDPSFPQPLEEVADQFGNTYKLAKVIRSGAISGSTWHLYQKTKKDIMTLSPSP